MSFENKNIWIIGCSSGIGAAVAKELSDQGAILALSARRQEQLEKLNTELGGKHKVAALDVSDIDNIKSAAEKLESEWEKIDAVINLAAIYKPGNVAEIKSDEVRKLVEVNLTASFYLAEIVLPILTKQGHGQFVLCGSVAGYVGLPGGQPYSATKAAIINFAESLHLEMKKAGTSVDVKVINPGFVKTPMTDKNDFDMPMITTPEKAAQAIAKGLLRSKFEIHFPRKFTNIMKLLEILPYRVYFWLAKKMA